MQTASEQHAHLVRDMKFTHIHGNITRIFEVEGAIMCFPGLNPVLWK